VSEHSDRNSGKIWSATEVEDLRDYALGGATAEEIAEFLMRSEDEILTKSDRTRHHHSAEQQIARPCLSIDKRE